MRKPCILLALILCSLQGASALAHLGVTPRVLQLRLRPDRIEVAVAEVIHPGPEAKLLRQRFDGDGDGSIDEQERRKLALWLDRRARRSLRFALDGVPFVPQVGELDVQLHANSDPTGTAIRLRSVAALAVVLRPGQHILSVGGAPAGVRGVLPLRIDLPAGVVLQDQLLEGEASELLPNEQGSSWSGGFLGGGGRVELTLQSAGRPGSWGQVAAEPTAARPGSR